MDQMVDEEAKEVANKEAKEIIKTNPLIVDIDPQDRTPTVWCHLFLHVYHKHDYDDH